MKCFRTPSDGLLPIKDKKQRLRKARDVPCPKCGAPAGVECPGAGYSHIERMDAWNAEKDKRAKRRRR
jgi:hypothetical protein